MKFNVYEIGIVALLFVIWLVIILFPTFVLDYLNSLDLEENRGIFTFLLPRYSPYSLLFLIAPVLAFFAFILTEVLICTKKLKKERKLSFKNVLHVNLSALALIRLVLLYGIVYAWFIWSGG